MKTILRLLALVIAAGMFNGSAIADEAKSYKVVLSNLCKVGDTEFQPGDYKVTVDGSKKVRFTAMKTGKTMEVEAKVESRDSKFDHTAVTSKRVDGVTRLSEIQIGGSKTKIAFD